MNKNVKKENEIKGSPEPVSISGTRIILNQMINCICKIKLKGVDGTGFFCEINDGNNNKLHFLVTNYHVIDKQYYEENNKINLLLNDDTIIKELDITIKRKTYFNENYDIALIEIQNEDEITNFLELDDNLFIEKEHVLYLYKSIYVLHYPKGKNACVSYGLLNAFDESKKSDIQHTCSTQDGSSGSPILNLETNKVIGIHKEGIKDSKYNYNIGTFLKYPLNEFFKNINNKSKKLNNKEHNDKNKNFNINFIDKKKYENIINEPKNIKIPKMNIIFKEVTFSRKTILILDYGTTIDQMLIEYLKKINKQELKGKTDKIYFSINLRRIEFGDQTPIEQFFDFNSQPNIDVNYT